MQGTPSRRAAFQTIFEQFTLKRVRSDSSSSVVAEIAPMWTTPDSSCRGAESQPSSSSMSSSVPKSRWACSGRLAKASLRSTLTTGTPRALQDSTKRAPMNPAAPVTRRVSGALTPPILRDLAWQPHVFFLCSRHEDQGVRETPFSPLQRRHTRGRGGSLEYASQRRRQDVPDDGRGDVHGRARPVARRNDPSGQGPRDHVHGGESRGRRLQPRRARPLRAHPALPRAEPRRGDGPPRAAPEPRDGHLHPGGGGDSPDRAGRARRVDGRGPRGQAVFPARVHVPDPPLRQAERALPDRPERLVASRGGGEEPADLRTR